LNRRFFAFLGEVSFTLYLVHGSVLYFVFQVIASQGSYGVGPFVIGGVIAVGVSFALSFVIARYVEMPLVDVVRRGIGKVFRDSKVA